MTEMSQWIDKVYIPTLFIALIVYHTDAYSSVTLDDVNCDSRVIYVSTQQSQRVEWKGTVIPKRCRVGFEATESPHAVCVDVEVFRDYKCTFTVKVYTEFSDSAIRTYDCDSTGTAKERCFDNKMIYLGFTFNTTGRSVNPSVKIEVKNKVDEDGSDEELNLPAIIISLFCFLCFLSFMFNKKLKEYLRDPCENICIPLLKVVTCPCCFLKEQCENCVTSIDTSGCRKVVSDCLARCHEQEATTTASTNVATETVTQQEGFPTIAIISLVVGFLPGVYLVVKYGCVCLDKCFCPMLKSIPESISECFCNESETTTQTRSNSSENVRNEPPRTVTVEPPPATTTEPNGILTLSGSMISLHDLADEPLNPSSSRPRDDWEPPHYSALSPIPPETMIEAPPTYYDVMTHDD